jgi:hypothetical protein
MGIRNIFIIIIVCILLYLSFTVGPIFYRGFFGLRGICSEQVNRYKKYGKEFVFTRVEEEMRNIGVPEDKYEYVLKVDDDANSVYLELYYEDTAEFVGGYTKKFEFNVDCDSGTKDVYTN